MALYFGRDRLAPTFFEESFPAILPPTSSLVYTLSSNGEYYIIGAGFNSIEEIEADTNGGINGSGLDSSWTGGKLVIPAEYNGKPVKAIAPKAFAAIYNITQVYIYDGLTTIGHRCFQCPDAIYDTAMISCRLPNTLEYVGGTSGRLFWGRQGLVYITFPDRIDTLTNSILAYCNAVTTVNLHSIKTIQNAAFQQCFGLTTLNAINLIEIQANVFYNCRGLRELNLPKIEIISTNCFYNTNILTSVTIGPNCKSIDNSGLKCGSETNKCTFKFEGTIPPIITTSTFEVKYINKIIVPRGCGNVYKTATNWAGIASYIEEEA